MGTWTHALKLKKELDSERAAYQELHGLMNPPPTQPSFAGGGEMSPANEGDALNAQLQNMGVDTSRMQHLGDQTPMATLAALAARNGLARGAVSGVEASEPNREPAGDTEDTSGTPTQSNAPPEPTSPQTSEENVLNIRDQLQKYLAQQTGGIDSMQKLADLYKTQLASENNRPNYSALNALADHYYGTNFSKTLTPPLKGSEQTYDLAKLQDTVNKERQPVTQDLLKEYGSDESAVGKAQANYLRTIASKTRDDAAEAKLNKHLDELEGQLTDKLNPLGSAYGSGQTNLGQRITRARSAYALLRQHPDLNLDPREKKDLALSMATMISNQGRVPYELVDGLDPKFFGADLAKAIEYVSGHPENTDSQEFVKRMAQTIDKERETAEVQIRAIQNAQVLRARTLKKHRLKSYNDIVQGGQNFLNLPGLDTLPASAGTSKTPQPVKNSKGEKGWLMPDGSIQPRK